MRSRKRALAAIGACILALAGCGEAPAPEPKTVLLPRRWAVMWKK